MSILERAKAHFESKGLICIEVPEWPDEKGNPTIMHSEPMTLADQKLIKKFAADDEYEFIVRLVIMKCEDRDGKKVFDLSEKPELMHKVDPVIISRIAAQIAETVSVEEQTGN